MCFLVFRMSNIFIFSILPPMFKNVKSSNAMVYYKERHKTEFQGEKKCSCSFCSHLKKVIALKNKASVYVSLYVSGASFNDKKNHMFWMNDLLWSHFSFWYQPSSLPFLSWSAGHTKKLVPSKSETHALTTLISSSVSSFDVFPMGRFGRFISFLCLDLDDKSEHANDVVFN